MNLGDEYFVMDSSSSLPILQTIDPKVKVPCKLCGTLVALNAMRNHVGRHIFLHKRTIVDPLIVKFQQYVRFILWIYI